ncbi:hypothetical protein LINGRAHAP2_LOCUS24661 [Linum grandiflorum]
MLERERERGRVRRAGGKVGRDREEKTLRIQDSIFSIQDSDEFAGAEFQISVRDRHGVFFVVLAEEHLTWLVDVLTVASAHRWTFPAHCELVVKGRSLHVGCMWWVGRRFLCLSEACKGGRSFFVRVPTERNSDGWPGLLRMLRGFGSKETAEGGLVSERSFAEVVRPRRFPAEGICKVISSKGTKTVTVDTTGVKERESFLNCCLVLRLVGEEMTEADWVLFGAWTQRWWGVSVEDRFPMADELWLLKLHREDDVARVMRLGRWNFRGRNIEADKWFPFAGRSSVSSARGVVWLKVDGIPLHLRSPSLFKQLGNFCGNYLAFEERGCSWSSVRVKIRQTGAIPSLIPVSFGKSIYTIQVKVEDSRVFSVGWRGSGSEVFIRVGDRGGGSRDKSEIFQNPYSGVGARDDGTADAERLELQMRIGGEAGFEGAGSGVESDLRSLGDERGERRWQEEREDVDETSKKVVLGVESEVVGVEVPQLENADRGVEEVLGTMVGLDNVSEKVVARDRHLGWEEKVCGPSPSLLEGVFGGHFKSDELEPRRRTVLDSVEAQVCGGLINIDKCLSVTSQPTFETYEDRILVESGEDSSLSEQEVSDSESCPEEDDISDGTEEVKRASLMIAGKLGLQIGESRVTADCLVSRVADEVLEKRNEVLSISKTERELRRIKIDGCFSDTVGRRSCRETKWSQCLESDVFFLWGNRQVDWVAKDSDGASGGILVAWDKSIFQVSGQWIGSFAVVVILESIVDGFSWCLVNCYGPCDRNAKERFITELRVFSQWWQMPLCFMGDFNLVRSLDEVSTGDRNSAEMELINDFIADLELIDLPLVGGRFTWTNFHEHPTLSRLDRVMVSIGWEAKFPDCVVKVLPRLCSDHNPLMLSAGQTDIIKRPWRFENMWLDHENFGEFLQEVWGDSVSGFGDMFLLAKRLNVLKEKLKVWNKVIFKCLEIEISRCLAVIADLDQQEESSEWTNELRVQSRLPRVFLHGRLVAAGSTPLLPPTSLLLCLAASHRQLPNSIRQRRLLLHLRFDTAASSPPDPLLFFHRLHSSVSPLPTGNFQTPFVSAVCSSASDSTLPP